MNNIKLIQGDYLEIIGIEIFPEYVSKVDYSKVDNFNSSPSKYIAPSQKHLGYQGRYAPRSGNNNNVLRSRTSQILEMNKGRESFGFSKKKKERYSKLIEKLK